jgi:ABC-type Mn2+/Zn2+ transport system permease subunit
MLVTAAGIGATATATGVMLSTWLHREPGPIIVLLSAATFLVTTIRRPA